jgi:hypothetical protein
MTSEEITDPGLVRKTSFGLLEGITAVVLAMVPPLLLWLVLAESLPDWCRLPSVELEIQGVLILLSVAILLVSALALMQTWRTGAMLEKNLPGAPNRIENP